MGYRSPQSIGGAGVSIMLYIDKVDDVFKRAIAAGAKELQAVKDQFYGDRSGTCRILRSCMDRGDARRGCAAGGRDAQAAPRNS